MTERNRHRMALATAWGGWLIAIAWTIMITMFHLPRSTGVIAVLFMGVGVTGSLVLSRHRLTDTITDVFTVGLRTATSLATAKEMQLRELHAEVEQDNTGEPIKVCAECTTLYPCATVRILDR